MIDMKNMFKKVIYWLFLKSLKSANKQRDAILLKNKLSAICPDLREQYSHFEVDMDNEYLSEKIRYQHTFQISLAMRAVELLTKKNKVTIGDIGDSAGTHILYLQNLLEEKGVEIDAFSVNLDKKAIEKIQKRGLRAIHCRAEDLHEKENTKVDIFLSFEMVEHLFNPISFLNSIAKNTDCEYFVISVPNVYRSRVGLAHIRNVKNTTKGLDAESTHIFELSPDDWNLIFQFSGWEIVYEDRYAQYPKWHLLSLTKYLWRKFDFDGFHGVVLKKNMKFADQYKDW
jgi:SAM-dependent methyltransferase